MVPVTPMGVLADLVRANIARGRQPRGTRTKVIEDGGVCTKNISTKSNQFPRDVCGREDCGICCASEPSQTVMRCSVRSVGYEGKCVRCVSKHAYIGETSKTAYTQIKEHLTA